MLSLPARTGRVIRPRRPWKTTSAEGAVAYIGSGATIAVGWIGDRLAATLSQAFLARGAPRDLTIVYAALHGDGRSHGLNHFAHAGMVRRVIGGQWYPVPALQALARLEQIEAYSLPTGLIRHLYRAIAAGRPAHLSRSGLGTFSDPRQGGGRLNRATRQELVRVTNAAGAEALLIDTFPIDIALISVGFMEESAAIAVTREAMTIARAAQAGGGLVIAQIDRIGTLDKLPPGQVIVADTLIDVLVEAEQRPRNRPTFSSPPGGNDERWLSH